MGFEANALPPNSAEIMHDPGPGAADALATFSLPMIADADLRQVVAAWPAMPDAIRAAVLALVKASKP